MGGGYMKWLGISLLGLSAMLAAGKLAASSGYVIVDCQQGSCYALALRGHPQTFVTYTSCTQELAKIVQGKPSSLRCEKAERARR